MSSTDIDRLILLGQNEGSGHLSRLISCAASLSNCTGMMLVAWTKGKPDIIVSQGIPIPSLVKWPKEFSNPKFAKRIAGSFDVANISKDADLRNEPLFNGSMNWKYLALAHIPAPWTDADFTLIGGHPGSKPGKGRLDPLAILKRMAEICADELLLLSDLAAEIAATSSKVASPRIAFAHEGADDTNLVSNFLTETLILQRRWLKRKKVDYHAIYRWRKPLKEVQIKALRAIKTYGSENLVEKMASHLANAATSIYGVGTIELVTNVPCGHSGDGCLISKVAPLVAKKLGVPYCKAFKTIDVNGSSHPKANVRRPSFKLLSKPKQATLVLDDVATSGDHIEEATTKLRQHSPAVFPLVWLSD